MKKKDIFNAEVKLLDIQDWESMIAVINEEEAINYWISAHDKIAIIFEDKEIVVNADISSKLVKNGQIWIFKDIYEKYWIKNKDIVWVYFTKSSHIAIEAIKKKLFGKKLTEKEIIAIVDDMNENRLTDTLITYFVSTWFFYKSVDQELARFTKATAKTWTMFKFPWKVAVKYCIWWVPWNETTMIMTPIISSLGIKFAKTFSKAITSPAATWECVEVLMETDFSEKEIKNLMKKNWCFLALGEHLNLAPANKKIIDIAYPISMEAYSKMVCGIMAQNYAIGINHLLIDIPIWETAKIKDIKTAKRIKSHFEYIWNYLWMKVKVIFTEAEQPIGNWIWADLQVREVLRVLQQHEKRPKDLEEKALILSAQIIELVWLAKGKKAFKMAEKQLKSWIARKKMQKIIIAQNGKNPNIRSEEIKLWKFKKEIESDFNWILSSVDMRYINQIARTLGCPQDYQAGIFLNKKLQDKVKKWDVLFTLYSNYTKKIEMAEKMLKEKNIYVIK